MPDPAPGGGAATAATAATVAGGLAPTPALGSRIGAGGEAEVFEVRGRREAYKRYRRATAARAAKLKVMIAHPPAQAAEIGGHVAIAWPRSLVSSDGVTAEGFVMPRVNLSRAAPLFQVYNPQTRARVAPGFTWQYLLRTARNVAAIVASLHDAGYVIGDLNESNFLVTDRALVVLVDCDSMQVRDPTTGEVHRGAVGKPEFLAPEFHGVDLARTDRTFASDRFALAILVFLLLMEGLHPFAGVWRGSGDPPDLPARMRARRFPYRPGGRLRPPRYGLPMRVLPLPLAVLVWRTFTSGIRHPRRRPTAREWVDVLEAAEDRLRVCKRSAQHTFGGLVRRCPWCARVDAGLPDPFPATDGTGVAPRGPSRVTRSARGVRRGGTWLAARVTVRARVWAATLSATAALTWFLPIAGLLVAVAAIPAAAGVVHGGRGDARWWRWRAIVRRVRSAWRAVRGGARRMHWAAAAATAAASSAIFLLDAGPWTAGRMAAVAAAVTHTAVNLRQ